MQNLLPRSRWCMHLTPYAEVRRVKNENLFLPSIRRNLTTHRSTSTHSKHYNNDKDHSVCVRSALSDGPIPYEKGWAWQHVLLNRRLNYMRMQQTLEMASDGNDAAQDKDWILMFEHQPVYTLGRGATEDYLTFLDNEPDGGLEKRKRLSRKYRGEDASRLNIDRFHKQKVSDNHFTDEQDEVDELANQSMCKSQPVLAPNGSPIYRIERGGEVTYHGPGQLVMYPLLDLKHSNYQQDLHWYLRQIEEVIIRTLLHFDIKSNRDDINTGVWVGQNKIAAVGVSATKWVTTHGLALNVSPNLGHFDKDIITPCGIEERGVTSISEVLKEASLSPSSDDCPTLDDVADVALKCFGEVFEVDVTEGCPIR